MSAIVRVFVILQKKYWFPVIVSLTIALALVLSSARFYSPMDVTPNAPLPQFTAQLDEHIPAIMQDYAIPGVCLALIRKGEIVWQKAYGYADLAEGRKMTVDTPCRVESISKSLTALGVIKLVEQGRIDLDAPLQNYLGDWKLPDTEFNEEAVTVRRLLSHTAGMPLGSIGPAVEYAPGSPMPLLREFLSREAWLETAPGSGFAYSNTGFNLLELLIEEVTGRRFAEYMADEVLQPLDMRQSTFAWNEAWRSQIPTGYDLQGRPVPPYVYPVKASGGLFATAGDIARFVCAGMKATLNTEKSNELQKCFQRLYARQTDIPGLFGLVADAYGFGHFIEILADGKKAVWHGGQGHGWMTHFHSVPETGDGMVMLTNSQRSWPAFAYILSDWARWSDVSKVGLEKIILGQKIVWTMIGLLFFFVLWQAERLVRGIISGRRRFTLWSANGRAVRLIQSGLFTVLISLLFCAGAQDYLVISSMFPIAASWLGYTLFCCALISGLSALFPA
ncbi:serine hydrolase domain-containing protein [Caldithrix abyssi]